MSTALNPKPLTEELSFKDFETMARGGKETQKQVQFLCPKMNHLSVDEKFSMRTPKVTKKFRFLYNKVASWTPRIQLIWIIGPSQ